MEFTYVVHLISEVNNDLCRHAWGNRIIQWAKVILDESRLQKK